MTTLASYSPDSERPWFGETILWMAAPVRAGDALCSEETIILQLPKAQVRA